MIGFILNSLLILLILFGMVLPIISASVNPLNGQYLRVLASEFPMALITKRNATGHIIYVDGVQKHLLESLSRMLNFSYSFLPIVAPNFDDMPQAKGIAYYLNHNEADYSLSNSIITPSKFQKVDFPSSFWYGSFSTLVPYPKEDTFDLSACLKPFSYMVWLMIAVSAFAIIFCLKLFLTKYFCDQVKGITNHSNIVLNVMGNLSSQGQHFPPKQLALRVLAGAWCCGCFFLVQAYCSTLTSHLTSPNQKLLINSFFEIADSPDVSLTIDKGFALDVFLQITESEHVKRFLSILRRDGRLITCNTTADCLKYVGGGHAVYSSAVGLLKAIVYSDSKSKLGNCRYTLTKEEFWNVEAYTPLRKNSPYTESISKGILRLIETGFVSEWKKWYVPTPSNCMEINKRVKKPKLSIKHLSGAFVILSIGCFLSAVVFVLENIRGLYAK